MLTAAILLGFNILTFAIYGLDKSAARAGGRRVPEKVLLGLGLLGGWPGAFFAQRLWRHKTQKLPFQFLFWLTILINCVVLWLLLRLLESL